MPITDDDQFEAGYNNAPTETPETKPVEKEAPTQEQQPEEQPDPIKDLVARMEKFEASQSKLAGHIGDLTRSREEIRQFMAASKEAAKNVSDAPSDEQVKDAMGNPKSWDALKEDFPEWVAATEEFLNQRLGAVKPSVDQVTLDKAVEQRVASLSAEMRQEAIDSHLDAIVDGDWEKTVGEPAFSQWLSAQPDGVKALAESSRMRDAARMLRLFVASKATPPPKKENSTKQRQRFEAALSPRSSGAHAPASSDEDEFEAGYRSSGR